MAAAPSLPSPGATPEAGGVAFAVWAPRRRRVDVALEAGPGAGDVVRLRRTEGGWHRGVAEGAAAGTLYRYRLADGTRLPDPASRYQPEGPHGPSEVVDASAFAWSDDAWTGPTPRGQVMYEMHVGTFTAAGTWAEAAERLPRLAEMGVTLLEVMPVAEFPGRFGWGYDGVQLFAPYHLYGRPDDLCAFVDRAHGAGLSVILDVVYNHLGPDGNHLPALAPGFLSRTHATDWGPAINFDGPGSEHVRAFYLANVRHWIADYHLDGLRVDATQDIRDGSEPHILAEITGEARRAAGEAGRRVFMVAENEPQDVCMLRSVEEGGYGFDAVWNDDVHHSAVVALTGRRAAYYGDHLGAPQELVSAARHGFLFQGQRYRWQNARRGTRAGGVPPHAFIACLENHDQLANSARGERIRMLADPGRYRAMTAYLLLGPATPMLFQGQEFGATTPFVYFADHRPWLAEEVRRGRFSFLEQFPDLALPEVQATLPDPGDPRAFERCRLREDERAAHGAWVALHRDLLALRSGETAFAGRRAGALDGAVLGERCFVLRFTTDDPDEERLLVVNLGADLELVPTPEPLLAPPAGRAWGLAWSSEDVRYGGRGTPEPETPGGWRLPGAAAVVLAPHTRSPDEEIP